MEKETYNKLLSNVLEQVDELFPGNSSTDQLAHQMAKIAATVSVVVLQEYEKLNQ